MDYELMEKDDRLLVDMKQNHALANLLRKAVWENGGEAGYDKGHPLGDESVLVIEDDDPEQVLEEAVDTARSWLQELRE